MNKRTTFVDVIVESIIILVSILLSCVASFLLGFFASLFSVGIPFAAYFAFGIHAVVFITGVFTTMSVIAYKMGYKTTCSSVLRTLASFSLVYAVLLIPAFIIALLSEGSIQAALKTSELFTPQVLSVLNRFSLIILPLLSSCTLLILVSAIFAFFAFFRWRGAKKRLADRMEMGIIKE